MRARGEAPHYPRRWDGTNRTLVDLESGTEIELKMDGLNGYAKIFATKRGFVFSSKK